MKALEHVRTLYENFFSFDLVFMWIFPGIKIESLGPNFFKTLLMQLKTKIFWIILGTKYGVCRYFSTFLI